MCGLASYCVSDFKDVAVFYMQMEITGADAERFLETVSPADLLSLPEGSGSIITSY